MRGGGLVCTCEHEGHSQGRSLLLSLLRRPQHTGGSGLGLAKGLNG